MYLIVKGITTSIKSGVSIRDAVVTAARSAGIGKFNVTVEGLEVKILPFDSAGVFANAAGCMNQCHAFSCPTFKPPNTSIWDLSEVVEGAIIQDESITTLSAMIEDERVRKNLATAWTGINTPYNFDAVLGTDEETYNNATFIYGDNDSPSANHQAMMKQFKESINEMTGGGVTYDVGDNDTVLYEHINEVITQIGHLRNTCLCDGQCGLNYTCVCFENCGTNYYSDERLKRNIRSI